MMEVVACEFEFDELLSANSLLDKLLSTSE